MIKLTYTKRPYHYSHDIKIPKPHKLDFDRLTDKERRRMRTLNFEFLVPNWIYWVVTFKQRRRSKALTKKLKGKGWIA